MLLSYGIILHNLISCDACSRLENAPRPTCDYPRPSPTVAYKMDKQSAHVPVVLRAAPRPALKGGDAWE